MILYSPVWPCMAMYGPIQPCMASYGPGDHGPIVPFVFAWSHRGLYCLVLSGKVPSGAIWSIMFNVEHHGLVWS